MVNQPSAGEALNSLFDLIEGFEPVEKLDALAIINQNVFPGGQAAGLPGIDAAIEALAAGGFFTPSTPTPAPAPPPSASTTVLTTGAAATNVGLFDVGPPTPVATGVDLQQQAFEQNIISRQEERATILAQVQIAQFLAETARASPTRAASINAILGLGENIDFGFADVFLGGGQLTPGRGGIEAGVVGGQQVGLPRTLSLNQLSFLEANPQIAAFVKDLSDFLGQPDIFGTSIASAIPTSSALAGLAA